MKRKNKKLTRLILGALLASGAMLTPGVASATDVEVGDTDDVMFAYNGYKGDDAAAGGIDGTQTGHNTTVSGGKVTYTVWGGKSKIDDVSDNTVHIKGGEVGNVYGGAIAGEFGWAGSADASGNTVNITGGTVSGSVYGGHTSKGNATGNTVTISGGTVGTTDAHGVYGGCVVNGAANNNTVIISKGTLSGSVWGGNGTTADGNTVTISGGTIAADSYIHGALANTSATNNTVNILTQIAVGGLAGGELMESGTSSGNTLNVAARGVSTGNLYAFQNINFFLPTDTVNGDTMLTVTGEAQVNGTAIGVAAQEGLTSLSKGDSVTLIKAGTLNADGFTTSDATTVKASAPTGITTSEDYEFEISKSGTASIIATVTSAKENNESSESAQEYAKSPVETRAATTTFVNAGADMLASQGFAQAANAVAIDTAAQAQSGAAGAPAASAFTPFAAFGGQSMRAQSGSYVDTKGFGLNIGFARELPNSQGKLLFGPVVEYGGGTYASHLENAEGTRGDGKAHYFGVGVMARQVNHDGFYYEGSVRGGRVTSDYRSFINNQTVDYDSSSNYWAAHVGVGKAFSVGGSNTLDGYLKYFYSHQAGDDVTMHSSRAGGDEAWSFDAVDSHRIRIGARLTHKVNEKNSFYGGLAYQYEFGGEARAHYNGTATPSPSVKGSSGMLELGWQVKPGGPVTIDLGVTGWAGKQRGGSVQLGATWTF